MCDIIEGKSHSNKGNVPSYELVPIMDKDLAETYKWNNWWK